MAFIVSGTVTVGGAAAPNGEDVEIWAYDGLGGSELIDTVQTSGGSGFFQADVPDNSRDYRAFYDDGTYRGMSAVGVPVFVTDPVTLDGPDDVMMPLTLGEWLSVGGGIPVPDYFQRLQMASGDAIDEVQGAPWIDSAAPEYAQAITDWDIDFVKLTETATEGFHAAVEEMWNASVQSIVWIGYFKAGAAASTRVFAMLAGADGYVAFNASGRLQLVNGLGTITGGTNYLTLDALVHPFVLEYICGAGILGHSGAGVYRLSTDKEQLVGTWDALPDGVKGIGGCGTFTPPEMHYGPQKIWVGSKAEALNAIGPKAVLEHFGWTVTGY